ncbi:MAG TPA: flavoprotein, partial [Nitrospiria bacterium]|nr:flavoprotein [Nitrospiria bacterium]
MLTGKKILLGITGSIAAYKSVALLRTLRAEGAEVTVVMTPSAQKFVAPLTFQALSGRTVYTGLFVPGEEMAHITLGEGADLILVAPATAHFLAKLYSGLADDLLSALILASSSPVLVVPAMDGQMWTK